VRFTVRQYGGEFERFADEAAESVVGKTFVAKVGDYPEGVGIVVEAKVVDEGRVLELTVEWPDA
jgi:hypothetical protein